MTRLDAGKYAKEKEELQVRISELEHLLANRDALIALLKKEMQQLIKQFGDERRTIIEVEGQANAPVTEVASLHKREPMVIAYTRSGAIKSLPADAYAPKGKNGDATYTPARGDEQLRQVVLSTSQDYVLCACSTGRVFQIAAHRIPQGSRSAKGEPLRKLLALAPGEEVVALLSVEAFDEDRYLVTFSKLGKVKKSPLSDYKTADTDGLLDMKLAEGDSVAAALISRGQGEYFVTTDNAQTLRFSDENLRAQGRNGQGVACIALAPNAKVVSAGYLDGEEENTASDPLSLFVLAESGLAKKVPLSQYPAKGRATGGVVTTELVGKDKVMFASIINERQHFLVLTNGDGSEQANVVKATEIKMFARARKGMPLVKGHILGVVELTS